MSAHLGLARKLRELDGQLIAALPAPHLHKLGVVHAPQVLLVWLRWACWDDLQAHGACQRVICVLQYGACAPISTNLAWCMPIRSCSSGCAGPAGMSCSSITRRHSVMTPMNGKAHAGWRSLLRWHAMGHTASIFPHAKWSYLLVHWAIRGQRTSRGSSLPSPSRATLNCGPGAAGCTWSLSRAAAATLMPCSQLCCLRMLADSRPEGPTLPHSQRTSRPGCRMERLSFAL